MKELSFNEINAVSGGLAGSLLLGEECEHHLLSAEIRSCLLVAGFVMVATTFFIGYFLVTE